MRVTDANAHLTSPENPKDILNKRTLVGGFDANLIKLINPQGDRSAEWALEGEDIAMQTVVCAEMGRNQKQWHHEKFEKPLAHSCMYLLPRHGANPPNCYMQTQVRVLKHKNPVTSGGTCPIHLPFQTATGSPYSQYVGFGAKIERFP